MSDVKKKILVVDDHKTVGLLMEAVLNLQGYQVLNARSGLRGLELVRTEQPELIFLDIMMPEMDGYQVCRALKADPDTRDIPVVFLTARGRQGDADRGREAGCDGYLTKPIKTMEVLEVLRLFLGEQVSGGSRSG